MDSTDSEPCEDDIVGELEFGDSAWMKSRESKLTSWDQGDGESGPSCHSVELMSYVSQINGG